MEGLRGAPLMEDRFLANMSQQRMERNQFEDIGGSERKDISRRSGYAKISQHKLQHRIVSLFLHQTKLVICLENQSTARIESRFACFFLDSAHTLQVKNTRSRSWGAAHERTKAVSSFLFAFWRNRSQVRGRGIMKKLRR